jgi:hypothetical protein
MSLARKSGVKSHLSLRFRTKVYSCQSASQPNATGFSLSEADPINADVLSFAADFLSEHSESIAVVTPAEPVAGSIGHQAPAASQSAQA